MDFDWNPFDSPVWGGVKVDWNPFNSPVTQGELNAVGSIFGDPGAGTQAAAFAGGLLKGVNTTTDVQSQWTQLSGGQAAASSPPAPKSSSPFAFASFALVPTWAKVGLAALVVLLIWWFFLRKKR